VDIAILIDSYRIAVAYSDHGFSPVLAFEIDENAGVFKLDIKKADVVLRKHRVSYAAYLNPDPAVVQAGDDGHVLLAARFHCVRNEFFHLLSAAYDRYLGVYEFRYDVAAMAASVKFRCHILVFFLFCSKVETRNNTVAINYVKYLLHFFANCLVDTKI